MKYPLQLPPNSPGVYIIKNKKNDGVYVGSTASLQRRIREWQKELAEGGINAQRISQAIPVPLPDPDWEFIVVENLPHADATFLQEREGAAMAAIVRSGRQLLNRRVHLAATSYAAAKSLILTDGGEPIPYAEAAKLTGYSPKTLEQKLARLRGQGKHTVYIKDIAKNPGRGRPKATS